MSDEKLEQLKREREDWGERIAAGPHVRLSVNQAQLMADYLAVSRRAVSAAWEYAMKEGVPIDPEHLKPPGESSLDSPEDRAAADFLRTQSQD